MYNWDQLHKETTDLLREMCAIPAPSNHEELRAEFCKNWFTANGFENVTIDEALNVLAPVNVTADNPITVIMAHTDTVFPDMEPMPITEKDGFMCCPGVGDDTGNLSVLMVCAKHFIRQWKPGSHGLLFVANSGEEGLGNLKGSRKIVEQFGSRISEFISLDSSCMHRIVDQAVGSHRYRVTVRTEGGHSYAKFGNRNAIHQLSALISLLYTVKVPQEEGSITTYNVGTISGGTSVNTIAQEAEMLYEYRSNNKDCLAKMQNIFEQSVNTFRAAGVEVQVEKIGDRPCSGKVDADRFEALRERVARSVREVLGMEIIRGASSTDCNIPLSLGIPAVCFGVIRSEGTHTRSERLEIASLKEGCQLLMDFMHRSWQDQ